MTNSIYEYINKRVSSNGYPIINELDYNYLINTYNKQDIIYAFIDVFIQNRNKKSIYRVIEKKNALEKLRKLKEKTTNLLEPTHNTNIRMKHDYCFDVGKCLGVIQLGHYYNDISNYYHQNNRMKCGGYNRVSPHVIWNGVGLDDDVWINKLKGFLSPLFRSVNNKKRITEQEYRFCFRLSSTVYNASQFRPEVAKTIIEKFSKKGRVIDPSMGWGDRLAGFYASNNGSYYIGTDPNNDLQKGYNNQIVDYDTIIKDRFVDVYNKPSEDMKWKGCGDFDLVFTSPPYFNTELYAENTANESTQSWYRYSKYIDWRDNYLFKTIDNIIPALTNDAVVAINIINITNGKENHKVCEDLYNHMINIGFKYRGYVGLRMKQRPKNISKSKNQSYMSEYYVEPIWIYEKFGVTG